MTTTNDDDLEKGFTDPFCIYELETSWSRLTRYQKGCRCRECKDACVEYWRARKQEQRARDAEAAAAMTMTHGTLTMWSEGCRCPRCRAAHKRIRNREKRNRDKL